MVRGRTLTLTVETVLGQGQGGVVSPHTSFSRLQQEHSEHNRRNRFNHNILLKNTNLMIFLCCSASVHVRHVGELSCFQLSFWWRDPWVHETQAPGVLAHVCCVMLSDCWCIMGSEEWLSVPELLSAAAKHNTLRHDKALSWVGCNQL